MLTGIAVTCVMLAAFAPISLFFLLTGSEYEFLLVLHVAIFAFCGLAGLISAHRNFTTLRAREAAAGDAAPPERLLLVW
ncbi:MAG TPA: actin-binding WH2 domain-containing protein, partial [Planctomycetia bacterium]|nr:actin-binding WH2 domain-containing protein [Planctomycetia bacterium]